MNSIKKTLVWGIIGVSIISNVAGNEPVSQPSIPANYKELPFVEKNSAPKLTAAEQQRGYMLFQRPIMEPVYPNTHPVAYERLNQLSAFAAQGELFIIFIVKLLLMGKHAALEYY
jgi:hypothetical protein